MPKYTVRAAENYEKVVEAPNPTAAAIKALEGDDAPEVLGFLIEVDPGLGEMEVCYVSSVKILQKLGKLKDFDGEMLKEDPESAGYFPREVKS